MKNLRGILIIAIFLILISGMLIGVASALETYKQNTPIDLKFTCTLNNAIPSASTTYNITIDYPNGTTFINNQLATPKGQGLFNYTTTFKKVGTYKVLEFCYDSPYSYSNTEEIEIKSTSLTFLIFIYALAIIFFISTLIVDEEFLVYISGVLFLVGGIYIMINGLEDINDLYSRTISYVSVGIGMLFTIGAYVFNSYSGRTGDEIE